MTHTVATMLASLLLGMLGHVLHLRLVRLSQAFLKILKGLVSSYLLRCGYVVESTTAQLVF